MSGYIPLLTPKPLIIRAMGWFVMYASSRPDAVDGMHPAAFFYSHDEACDWILGRLPMTGFWLEPGWGEEEVG